MTIAVDDGLWEWVKAPGPLPVINAPNLHTPERGFRAFLTRKASEVEVALV
jgi:hypothetical protein